MFEGIIKLEALDKIFRGLDILVSEAKFTVNYDDGLKAIAVDPANVCMVGVEIPAGTFEVFNLQSDEESIEFAVDVSRVLDIMKKLSKKDMVEVKVTDTEFNLKAGNISYSIPLIDPSAIRKSPKVPELQFIGEVHMDSEEFKKAINLANKISDEVELKIDENYFYITASADVDKVTAKFHKNEVIEFKFEPKEGEEFAKSLFGSEYLASFMKIAKKKDFVNIKIGNDIPGYFLISDSYVDVFYILAPRIKAE